VVLNVTVVDTTATSHLTVYPAGQTLPRRSLTSTGWPGRTVPNLVIATVGHGGISIEVSNFAGSTDVIVDVVGWSATRSQWAGIRQVGGVSRLCAPK
jgi:hypothetical protein